VTHSLIVVLQLLPVLEVWVAFDCLVASCASVLHTRLYTFVLLCFFAAVAYLTALLEPQMNVNSSEWFIYQSIQVFCLCASRASQSVRDVPRVLQSRTYTDCSTD